MEFELSWNMKYQVNNQMDFREVHWHYDMLEKRLKEKEISMHDQMEQMKNA